MDSQRKSMKKILMFPWLAHGHIFPYLQLAKRLSTKKNFHIHLCTTAVNFPSITAFLHKYSLENSISTIPLHLHPNPALPPHLHTTKNLPSHLRLPLIKAFQTAQSSFSLILADLLPDLLIFDVFQPWAAAAAASLLIPAVHFAPLGAATISYTRQAYNTPSLPPLPFPQPLLRPSEKRSLDSLFHLLLTDVYGHGHNSTLINFELSSEVVLLRTIPSLEDKYINYLSEYVSRKRILPVGALVDDDNNNDEEDEENSDMMRWLGEKQKHSTVYISFGSEYSLSNQEISELAKGLEISTANFIWVIRSLEPLLPEGFLDWTRERGRVVVGWAPQERILKHPSVGAFVSHCGWSSVNESVYHGVPVVGMPVNVNMFVDAKVLAEAGVCVEVEREEDGGFKGEEIANAIDAVLGGERQGLRRRATELSEKMKMEEEAAIDQVADQLWHLCCKRERET
ncbi:beta-D-glucosyl crocetin beta-1,6-glucosyltransferase [Salvia divinorum]|uniref:Beta-D-glucosyl crocetin beta-1,6-glucosyltransferase n=1 Tax=Salvia divinorum TaxID=28513 RepID=A0ABD1G831_SALDI